MLIASPRIPVIRRVFTIAALAICALPAMSQEWPSRPIRVIVSFPPGSSPDVIARAVAPGLQQALGQPIVIENKAGASGTLGADFVAKSDPDGYTVLMTSGSSMAIAIHTFDRLPFNPTKDLLPVAAGARLDLYLVARPSPSYKTYAEFQRYLQANPGKLTYASPGTGSAPHIAAELFKSKTKSYAVHIPYKGSAPALQDLLAGVVDFTFDPGIALNFVRGGKLSLLAVGAPKRLESFPDVPTLNELGVKDFDVGTTHAFYVPARTPKAVIDRLNKEINRQLMQPEVAKQIRQLGAEPTPMSPTELAQVIAADSKRYGAIVKEHGIKE